MDNNSTRTPPAEPGDNQAMQLVDAAERILNHLTKVPGLDLRDPVTFLALQLLGPVLARAIGDDPKRSMDNLIAITEQLDIDALRRFLKGTEPQSWP